VKNFKFDKSYNPCPAKIENFTPAPGPVFVQNSDSGSCLGSSKYSRLRPVSSEMSDFTPWAHAQSNILRIQYAEKIDDQGLVFWCLGECVGLCLD